MYGLIGKMRATPGQRDALIAILVEGVSSMPGCLSYVVAQDPKDPDAIWITEVWDSKESHKASLSLSSVQDAIARRMLQSRACHEQWHLGQTTVIVTPYGSLCCPKPL